MKKVFFFQEKVNYNINGMLIEVKYQSFKFIELKYAQHYDGANDSFTNKSKKYESFA